MMSMMGLELQDSAGWDELFVLFKVKTERNALTGNSSNLIYNGEATGGN